MYMANIPDVEKTTYSLDDLLAMDARVEIINGEMVEMAAAGVLHHVILGNIFRTIEAWNRQHETGFAASHGLMFLMHSDERAVQNAFVPDVSFVQYRNILTNLDLNKPFPGIPDLAVEVISPNDKAVEVQEKIQTYLDKGAEQVCAVYPASGSQSVHQYIQGSSTVRIYQKPEEAIDVSGLFPGLNDLTLEVIFKLPAWAKG